MKVLTEQGRRNIEDIAGHYKLKTETVEALLNAIVRGNGSMAQFNIPELGGGGQWMKGGMTMVGDMFNNSLKSIVDRLSNELSGLLAKGALFEDIDDQPVENHLRDKEIKGVTGSPWPSIFGTPTSSGSQNNFRYAYFAPVRRLVIEENGKQIIYDTKHHQISGISQQQGSGTSYKFSSQDGPVTLDSLDVISEPGKQSQPTPELAYDVTTNVDSKGENTPTTQDIIISTIEKINILFERGQITEEEFKTKKQELLDRL
ncbi:SHOCT domain-containing protein [Dyadobacter bucti]|uniref:SHOCT domain-containing protein n=1 Tax=Dyadobacter bucti TaxID=2572203 RepID=UPI0011099C33|nr:SHOCT domain-containing protein [Dyadobacter bucti]